jgi:hypothetical protein
MEKQRFPIFAVLTCASTYSFISAEGVLAINDFLAQLMPVCNFITQTKNWNHDIPRITKEIKPYLVDQHPWIAELEERLNAMSDEDRSEQFPNIMIEVKGEHGDELELFPMHPEDHTQMDDPVESFKANYGFEPDFTEVHLDDDQDQISPHGDINW